MIAVHVFRWLCLVAGIGELFLALLATSPIKGQPPTNPAYIATGLEIAFVLLAVWALLTVLSARRAP